MPRKGDNRLVNRDQGNLLSAVKATYTSERLTERILSKASKWVPPNYQPCVTQFVTLPGIDLCQNKLFSRFEVSLFRFDEFVKFDELG